MRKINTDWKKGRYISVIHNPPIPTMGNMEIPPLAKDRMGMGELLHTLKRPDWMEIPILGMGKLWIPIPPMIFFLVGSLNLL